MKLMELIVNCIFWFMLFLCPLLLTMTITVLVCIAIFGSNSLIEVWHIILVSILLPSIPASILLTEIVRRKYGVIELFSMLMNNKELNKRNQI